MTLRDNDLVGGIVYLRAPLLCAVPASMGASEEAAAARIQAVQRGRLARFSVDRRRRSLVRQEATARWDREQAAIKIQVRFHRFYIPKTVKQNKNNLPKYSSKHIMKHALLMPAPYICHAGADHMIPSKKFAECRCAKSCLAKHLICKCRLSVHSRSPSLVSILFAVGVPGGVPGYERASRSAPLPGTTSGCFQDPGKDSLRKSAQGRQQSCAGEPPPRPSRRKKRPPYARPQPARYAPMLRRLNGTER